MRLFTVNSVIYYTFLYYKLVKKVKMIFGLSSTMFIKIEMAFACLKACRCSGPISLKHTHTHIYVLIRYRWTNFAEFVFFCFEAGGWMSFSLLFQFKSSLHTLANIYDVNFAANCCNISPLLTCPR